MLHMLCKIIPIACNSTQNSNLLKILLALQGKRKHTNIVNGYAGKHQQILQVLNTSSEIHFEVLISCESYNTMLANTWKLPWYAWISLNLNKAYHNESGPSGIDTTTK